MLVFVDLVALLIRLNLGLIQRDCNPIFGKGTTFKLVIYASFATRQDAVGLALLEGLQEITEGKKLENFELILRISSESRSSPKPNRWDEEYIRRQVKIHSKDDLAKIYVCGPPMMSETFDRTFDTMIREDQLKSSQVEIM